MPQMKISFLGTGSGTSTNRAHTAMVYDCDDGTRLLIDTSSGNTVARNASELGIPVGEFDTVLLSHHHPDHMSGLLFIQFTRALARQDGSALNVYLTEESREWAIKMCAAAHLNVAEVDKDGAKNSDGRQVMRWTVVSPGEQIDLGRDPFLQFDHGNEMLSEEDAAWPVRANLQAGLFANQVGDPGALQFLVDGRQVQGAQGFALLPVFIDLVLGPLLFSPLGLDGEVVGDADD